MESNGSDPQRNPTPTDAGDGPQARRRWSITDRLRWSYLVSSTLPLLLVGTVLIVVLLQVQQRNAFASQQAVADQIAGNIATFLYDLEQQLLRAGRDLSPLDDEEALARAVNRLVNNSPDLRAITVVDDGGAPLAQETNDLLAAQNIAPAPVEQRLIGGAIGIGQGGRTTIIRGTDEQPIFHVVLPVRDPTTGRIAGALAAEVSAARIGQILRLAVQGEGKTAYIVDPRRSVLLTDRTPGWQPPPDLEPLFASASTVGEYRGGNGQMVVGARAPVAPINASSWSVVVEQPSSELFVEVYRSVMLLAALIGLMGFLALAWALFQSRRIVNPIRALTAGAQELAGGRLEHRIEVEPGDELGQLATTFNDMAGRLQGSLREIERQNEHLRHGLALARDIQQGLLPSAPPWRNEILSVYGRSLPASEIGGDFYTYMALADGRAAVAIGDISGKGVAAALLMALTSSTLESQAHFIDHPAAMLRALHEALRPRLQANQMNAALQIAVFSSDARSVTVANAGMIAPLLARCAPGEPTACSFIEVGGLPIGTPLDAGYVEVTVPLTPGDTLIFLSDGIVEAHNEAGELYGFERLEAAVLRLPAHLGVVDLVQRLLDEALAFTGDAEAHDD
ncbi:MAG TPA: SpoIIE family protein phosphatase, partial [Chloroflexaceae bacterium]|nr:SpoIIE family protein phosphatase [Chloroflexaceae bacterium]